MPETTPLRAPDLPFGTGATDSDDDGRWDTETEGIPVGLPDLTSPANTAGDRRRNRRSTPDNNEVEQLQRRVHTLQSRVWFAAAAGMVLGATAAVVWLG